MDCKTPANDETEASAPAEAPTGQAQPDRPLFEARQPERISAGDGAGLAPSDEEAEWEPGDEAEVEKEPGDALPPTEEMFEPETPADEDSDEEPPKGLERLNQNIEQLLVTMDGLAADGADSRSMLERMTEG